MSVSVSVSIGRLSVFVCEVDMEELRLGLVKVQVVWFAWVVADGISKLVPSGMLMMPVSVAIGLVPVAELLAVREFVSSGMVAGPVGVPVWDSVAVWLGVHLSAGRVYGLAAYTTHFKTKCQSSWQNRDGI